MNEESVACFGAVYVFIILKNVRTRWIFLSNFWRVRIGENKLFTRSWAYDRDDRMVENLSME